jgi:hypothetical protein
MKAQLLKDLQGLQTKADSFFADAQENASEHGAGYFYIARKVDKMIGYLTGTRDQKKQMTLTELRKILIEIAREYGSKIGIDYGVSLSIECDEKGQINYECEIHGIKAVEGRDRYTNYNRVYGKLSFDLLIAEFKGLLDIDAEARKDDNELEKDITAQ